MAALASLCLTAKQTECSELAWLIMMTFTLASRTVVTDGTGHTLQQDSP